MKISYAINSIGNWFMIMDMNMTDFIFYQFAMLRSFFTKLELDLFLWLLLIFIHISIVIDS